MVLHGEQKGMESQVAAFIKRKMTKKEIPLTVIEHSCLSNVDTRVLTPCLFISVMEVAAQPKQIVVNILSQLDHFS